MRATPTAEQVAAVDAFTKEKDLALVAGAGTGKTATLVLMGESTRRRGIYIAFNKAIADEARTRFGANMQCRTAHSLANRAVLGPQYRERLQRSARLPGYKTAELLGIKQGLDVDSRQITVSHQARLVMEMVRRFCYSTDRRVSARHLGLVNGLDDAEHDFVASTLLPFAQRAWDDISRPDGVLRFEHDHYLKMWALSEPQLGVDFVLLDEAQDTNPVLEEVFLAQDAQKVCVGDPAQQIYEWRNAQDVMEGFPADKFHLTQSFRFGSPIAALANRWLGHAGSTMQLTGHGPTDCRIGTITRPEAVLCRTNADAMQEVLTYLDQGFRVALTGGGQQLNRIADAADELKAGKRTSHPELFLFGSWHEVQEYVEQDQAGQDLRALVQLVDTHGSDLIRSVVQQLSGENRAQVTISTAHKAKGREWSSVKIGRGFQEPSVDAEQVQRNLPAAEARLIYVAVTRASRELDATNLNWLDRYEHAIAQRDAALDTSELINHSLTSQLKRANAPMTQFVTEHLPRAHGVVEDYLHRISRLPRPVQPIEAKYPHWSNLGHTIDYRLRLRLGGTLGGAVEHGIALLAGTDPLPGAPAPAVRSALGLAGQQLVDQIDDYLTHRTWIDNHLLSRLCYVAGFFEDVFRTGEVRRNNPLSQATPAVTLDQLTAHVATYVLTDIDEQLHLADEPFAPLQDLPAHQRVCGPVFTGSADIGGADADFILNGLLLDCKASIKPHTLGSKEIYQLAGYLLLDYDDEHHIDRVGVYLSRQGSLLTWTVEDFLTKLGTDMPLGTLRQQLRTHLKRAHQTAARPHSNSPGHLHLSQEP